MELLNLSGFIKFVFQFLLQDFKPGYTLEDSIEIVDIYQIMAFLLNVPPNEHDGNWDRWVFSWIFIHKNSDLIFFCLFFRVKNILMINSAPAGSVHSLSLMVLPKR